jgi:hypothetical protein
LSKPITLRPSAFAWCSTICRPIRLARSIKPSRPRKPGAGCVDPNSTTSPSTPAGSTLVEIEIGVLASQCLDRRIDSYGRLVAEIAAWEKRRNAERACIKWMFTTEKARAKMGVLIPSPPNQADLKESKPL